MKISRLFHWLYAFLMLLPVFFVGGRCLYTIFNKNAKDSYSASEVVYQRVRKNLPTSDILEIQHYYYLDEVDYDTLVSVMNYSGNMTFTILEGYVRVNDRFSYYMMNSNNYAEYYIDAEGDTDDLTIYEPNYANFGDTFPTIKGVILLISLNLDQEVEEHLNELGLFENLNIYNFDFLYEYQEQEVSYLDNAFEYSMEQLNEVPLFSWAKESFLVAPFSYISGLFGIAISNPINTILSYWLSISIIWLVFDLVMYVPLLVHRWLDKGVVE